MALASSSSVLASRPRYASPVNRASLTFSVWAVVNCILERSDLLACHRIIILALSLNLEGLTTRELMGKAGTKNHNRRALQRQLQYLMVKGIVKRELLVRHGSALYRLALPYAIKVRENSIDAK